MRIDDFISQLIAPVPAAPPRRQGGVAGVDSGQLGTNSGRRSGMNSPRIRASANDGIEGLLAAGAARRARQSDRADLSSLRASRAGASTGELPSSGQPAATTPATTTRETPEGASIVESFIRQRAVLAYRFPQQSPGGPQIDFTLEVEVAYRVIDIIPGGLVDEEA